MSELSCIFMYLKMCIAYKESWVLDCRESLEITHSSNFVNEELKRHNLPKNMVCYVVYVP